MDDLLAERAGAHPVHIERDEFEGYYEEFANRVLWPLFHNLPGPPQFEESAWHHYEEVNRRFADLIVEHANPGDVIWVHDYQLALVPRLLRDRGLDCAIGFFLHIPFPAEETYRTLPVRESILRGMLGADLLGFQTYEFASHFNRCCSRVLGLEVEPDLIRMETHSPRVAVLPIGVEPDELAEFAKTEEAIGQYRRLKERYREVKVVLGVDRLDYTKGIPQRLLAFEELLQQHPELTEKVVLIQISAPSRTGVLEYRDLKHRIDELVGRINGEHGTLDWTPVVYINRSLSRERLVALYRRADVALVTPIRDGMNLVSLEYVAARGDEPGALVLSEFAGAADWLPGARLVNPHNPSRIAAVLADALTRSPDPAAFEQMREFVRKNTSTVWARRFVNRLEAVYGEASGRVRVLNLADEEQAGPLWQAEHRLFLLDYDGTLVPHERFPEDAAPPEPIRDLLRQLAALATVYVISGRSADVLDSWLGDLGIGLICEHGLAIKHPGASWDYAINPDQRPLHAILKPVLNDFTLKTPGSHVEWKAASVAWHYRPADPQLGEERARELLSVLENRLVGQPFSILSGSKIVEVRRMELSKGAAAVSLLEAHPQTDFVFCAGDDRTDEEMFEALLRLEDPRTVVCHVGGINTLAPYVVPSTGELVSQLATLAASGIKAR